MISLPDYSRENLAESSTILEKMGITNDHGESTASLRRAVLDKISSPGFYQNEEVMADTITLIKKLRHEKKEYQDLARDIHATIRENEYFQLGHGKKHLANSYFNMAKLSDHSGQPEEAKKEIEAALKVLPKNEEFLLWHSAFLRYAFPNEYSKSHLLSVWNKGTVSQADKIYKLKAGLQLAQDGSESDALHYAEEIIKSSSDFIKKPEERDEENSINRQKFVHCYANANLIMAQHSGIREGRAYCEKGKSALLNNDFQGNPAGMRIRRFELLSDIECTLATKCDRMHSAYSQQKEHYQNSYDYANEINDSKRMAKALVGKGTVVYFEALSHASPVDATSSHGRGGESSARGSELEKHALSDQDNIEAEKCFSDALDISSNDEEILVRAYEGLAQVEKDPVKAKEYSKRAFEKAQNPQWKLHAHLELAKRLPDGPEKIRELKSVSVDATSMGASKQRAAAEVLLGNCVEYKGKGEGDPRIHHYKTALGELKYPVDEEITQNITDDYKKYKEEDRNVACSAYRGLGNLYSRYASKEPKNDHWGDKAIACYENALLLTFDEEKSKSIKINLEKTRQTQQIERLGRKVKEIANKADKEKDTKSKEASFLRGNLEGFLNESESIIKHEDKYDRKNLRWSLGRIHLALGHLTSYDSRWTCESDERIQHYLNALECFGGKKDVLSGFSINGITDQRYAGQAYKKLAFLYDKYKKNELVEASSRYALKLDPGAYVPVSFLRSASAPYSVRRNPDKAFGGSRDGEGDVSHGATQSAPYGRGENHDTFRKTHVFSGGRGWGGR